MKIVPTKEEGGTNYIDRNNSQQINKPIKKMSNNHLQILFQDNEVKIEFFAGKESGI